MLNVLFCCRLEHLILVDPWGFPPQVKDVAERRPTPSWWVRTVISIGRHFNPLAVFRAAGPFGPSIIPKGILQNVLLSNIPVFHIIFHCLTFLCSISYS